MQRHSSGGMGFWSHLARQVRSKFALKAGLDDLGIEEGLAELGHHVRISIEAVDGLDVVLAPVVEDVRDEQDVEVGAST